MILMGQFQHAQNAGNPDRGPTGHSFHKGSERAILLQHIVTTAICRGGFPAVIGCQAPRFGVPDQ